MEIITTADQLSLSQTFDCGQCFRWQKIEENVWSGIIFGRVIKMTQLPDKIILEGVDEEFFSNHLQRYFDLDRDYSGIKNILSADSMAKTAIDYAPGIRILNQDPFETLCSFIISQNNNIPRIKGIIDKFCRLLGTEIEEDCYSFPTPEAVAKCSIEDLAPIKSGFRAKYLLDCAQKICDGTVDINLAKTMDTDTCREYLMQIKGIGPKVADCSMLFAFEKIDVFPKDVWIKKAMASLYPDGLPECFNDYMGIAQQYIFNYVRNSDIEL